MFTYRKPSITTAPNGRTYLNLGCGARVCEYWNHVDFSTYALLRNHMRLARLLRGVGLISDLRWSRLCGMKARVTRHDLRKGIPWGDGVFDFVYHSHFLEHLYSEDALAMLKECYRVLKPNGVLRVVVPDLNKSIRKYNETWDRLVAGDKESLEMHQEAIREMYGQMVRQEATGIREQSNRFALFLEKCLRSNPEKTGELHRWMYNEFTLSDLLEQAGFRQCVKRNERDSYDSDWSKFELDTNPDGSPYKQISLYIEAVKCTKI